MTYVIILVNCIQQYLSLIYTAGLSWESLSTFQSVYSLYIKLIQVSQPKTYFILKQTSTWCSVSESDVDSVTALTDSTSSSSEGFIILIQTGNSWVYESFWMIHSKNQLLSGSNYTCHVTRVCLLATHKVNSTERCSQLFLILAYYFYLIKLQTCIKVYFCHALKDSTS